MMIRKNNKIFSNNTGLVSHRIEHTGEKPKKCSHCDKTFSIKSHLNNIPIYILMINPICVILPQGIHNKGYSCKTYAYAYWGKSPYVCGPTGVVIVFRLYQ